MLSLSVFESYERKISFWALLAHFDLIGLAFLASLVQRLAFKPLDPTQIMQNSLDSDRQLLKIEQHIYHRRACRNMLPYCPLWGCHWNSQQKLLTQSFLQI